MAILTGEKVSKYFGGLGAVVDVDFELKEGEIFGLIGPNGAGKTTLFNVIAGALPPTSGKVSFRGAVISGLRPNQIVRKGICRTFQVVKPLKELSVLDNVAVGVYFGRSGVTNPRKVREEARRVLEFVGLASQAHQPAKSLTIGNLKRLEIARALATRPDILLLDEICGGLNPAETRATMDLMRVIRDQGIAIFYIEHNMRAVMGVCDRIMVLNYGRKIAEGTPAEISEDPQVIEAYLGTAASA